MDFVPAVNLLYQAAITVYVDELIECRRFRVVYQPTSRLGDASHEYLSYRGTIQPRFHLPIKGILTFITERLADNFLLQCGKTQLDSSPMLRLSRELITGAMCLPGVEDVSH